MCPRLRARVLAFLPMVALACSSSGTADKTDADGVRDALAVGTGGQTASGGTLGSGGQRTGGSPGTGGTVASGGQTGFGGSARNGGAIGSGGAGGSIGSGGATKTDAGVDADGMGGGGAGGLVPGTGGSGSGGTSGNDAGRPDVVDVATDRVDANREDGAPDAVADQAPDLGAPDSPPDVPVANDGNDADLPPTGTLDDCFKGLPPPVGWQMVATKSTADGKVRVRIALDTEDRMGTSGTYGWGLIRLGVEVDGVVTCITNRANLGYGGSHHNCSDTASATAGTTTYSFVAPDRSPASMTIKSNGATAGPYTLTDTECTYWGMPRCGSGGPC